MKQSVEEALISLGNFGTLQLITTAVFSLYQFIACVVAFSVSITLKVSLQWRRLKHSLHGKESRNQGIKESKCKILYCTITIVVNLK